MSDEVKSEVTWQGVKLDTYTNLRTGEIKVYTRGFRPLFGIGATLVATSKSENGKTTWFYNDQDQFRRSFNNAQRNENKPELTRDQFNKKFFTKGTNYLNGVRAEILQDKDSRNYQGAGISTIDKEQIQQELFNGRIPGVIDPVSKRKVNPDGTVTTTSTTGQQPVVQQTNPANPALPPDPNATAAAPLLPDGTPDNTGTDLDGDGVISQGDNPSYEGEVSRGGTKKILKYPYHAPPAGFEYDYISITACDYKPSGLNVTSASYSKSDKNIGTEYETIFFPMQPQLSETNAVSWSDDQLNPIQAVLGGAAKSAIEAIPNFDLQQFGNIFSRLGKTVSDITNDPLSKNFISAYFAGQAVGANLIGRTEGMVINPNLELLFNGPNLRTFNFNFRLTPRSEPESKEIRRIIRAFKRNMAVSRSSSNLFLTSPRIFKLKYIYKGGGDHPYLNKFKPCALSNFTVNYTPDGSYATFDSTGSLTAYDLTMTFSEIMPIYADDIPDNTEITMGY